MAIEEQPVWVATDCRERPESRKFAAQAKEVGMAKLVFGMNQSLDGYVDHTAFAPSPTLFRHFIEENRAAIR